MNLSVIVPLYNEEESLPELCSWIKKVMDQNGFSYEVILVDDGSRDDSWNVVEEISKNNSSIKGIKFQRNYGKSAALFQGFTAASGDVVVTMDADLQDSPDEIPELYRMITEENYDLVSGWKQKRYDPISKTLPSKFFNSTVRIASGIKLHDFNCGLKAYKNKVVKSVEVYGEMHRYIPVLAKWAGFTKIGEKIVQHQKRKYGVTKFGIERFITGYLDLLSVMFISRFGKKPMHLFGTLGTLMFLVGFCFTLGLAIWKFMMIKNQIDVVLLTDKPHFFVALTLMIIGSMLFLTGFLGELISRNSYDRNKYLVETELNF
ncbi:glycosyltransferase family 2 protein [Bacteroidales bacterium]|nr:glycosyltransferase family 2 protein [Bacteroidales bacterium]